MYTKFLSFKHKHKSKISLTLVMILLSQCMSFTNIPIAHAESEKDIQKPAAPSDFNVVAVSGSAITLGTTKNMKDNVVAVIDSEVTFAWNEAVDNAGVEGYEILCDNVSVAYTDKTEYTFPVRNRMNAQRYCVVAHDKSGNVSDKSNMVHMIHDSEAFYNDNQPPSKPENVTVETVSGSAIRVAWKESTDNVGIECYEIYKNGSKLGFTRELAYLDYEHRKESYNAYTIAAYDLAGNISEISDPAILSESQQYFDFLVHKTDRFIVKYKDGSGSDKFHELLQDSIKGFYRLNNRMNAEMELIILKEKVVPENFINAIKEKKNGDGFDYNLDIEYIQEDYQFKAASLDSFYGQTQEIENALPEMPEYSMEELIKKEQGGSISETDVPEAWSNTRDKDLIVAVLDTGVDITHKDLQNNIWVNANEVSGNNIDDDGNGFADDINGWNFTDSTNRVHEESEIYDEWHGTHIAGIIASTAPETLIMPLKVLKNGMAYTSDIISAIDYADRMGVRIVNCSWESANYNPALKDMIDHSDMLFVCAAGNGHINIDEAPVYPAAFDSSNIISVASANKEGILSRFSNYGEYSIDVAAPGEDIMSAQPEDKYAFSSGSSLTAAFVSGEASLLLRTCGDDVYEIKDRIIKTSDRFSSLEGKTPGGRKVNSSQAVSNIASEEIIKVDVIDDMKYSTNAISSSEGENTLKTNAAWESKADLPDSKSGLAAVELDGKIYALGGWYRFHSLNKYRSLMSVHQYDPISDTWTQKRGMDGWRYKPAVAVNNRKIYVFGGMQDNSLFLNTMEEYDPQNDVWTKKANMPTARAGACAVAVNHLIYIIGGGNENGLLNTVDVYDTVTNTWTSAPNILAGRFGAGAALIDNKIYVAGGMLQNTLEIFDLSTNTWTLGASMSKPRFMGGLVAVGGRLFAVGGLTEPVAESQVDGYIETSIEEYMPLTDSWKVNSYMANRMHDFGITTYNNEIYIIGGANGDTDFNTTDVFLPVISENDQFTYIYDQNNRLIEIKKSSRSVATLHYDKNGNLIFIQLVE
ncbi:MAG: hypothetical protein E7255_01880 [Lachnospiraceae bacterium]|nr:hypothetical protein [Lachnospiraceae bacterium]